MVERETLHFFQLPTADQMPGPPQVSVMLYTEVYPDIV